MGEEKVRRGEGERGEGERGEGFERGREMVREGERDGGGES